MKAGVTPQQRWLIGLPLKPLQVTVQRGPCCSSFRLGARKAFQWTLRVYASLRSLIVGDVPAEPEQLRRHRLHDLRRRADRDGHFLYILGVLNINLGVMNLLPVPVLDGGHLMFAVIEKIRG